MQIAFGRATLITGLLPLLSALPARAAPSGEPPARRAAPASREAPARRAAPASREAPARRAAPRRVPPQRLVLRGEGPGTVTTSTGDYDGVTPGLPTMPRIHLPRNAARYCYLTWTGFQLLPNGSRLFLQLNREPEKALHQTPKGLRVELGACRVAQWNNLRPLDTRFFDTPVARARVTRARRKGLTLHIQLQRPATPTLRVVRLQGWTYLFVTFQHGRSRPAPAPRAQPRPAAPRTRPAPKGPTPP